MRERKYNSGCQCGICPSQTDKLCAQQTASLLSEKPGGFFDSLKALRTVFSPQGFIVLQIQITFHQGLEHLVPVQLADKGPGAIVIGDIGGVLG